MSKEKIFREISKEREKQDLQWGGPQHDDMHDYLSWVNFIDNQVVKAYDAIDDNYYLPEYRERLVKISALSVAAIESFDRKEKNG